MLLVALANETVGVQLPSWATESLKNSPSLVFAVLIFWMAFKYITAQHVDHLKSKDAEIDRLVKEKAKLQDIILKNRLSTETEQAPSKPGKKNKP